MNRAMLSSMVLSSAVTLACSGNSVSDTDGAGGLTSGGSAPASGGSAPAASGAGGWGGAGDLAGLGGGPRAQGNLALSVQTSTTGSANCPVAGRTYLIGNPTAPSFSSPGDRFLDGESGATIECSVRGSGPYAFSATIQALSSQSDAVKLNITNGIINADKTTGSATVSVFTPQLAARYVSAEGSCPVTVVGQNVKSGSLWAMVSCPSVADATTGQTCSVGLATTFVLENCDGA